MISDYIERLMLLPQDKDVLTRRCSYVLSVDEAVRGCHVVIDAIVEQFAAKVELFNDVSATCLRLGLAPSAIVFWTNTISLRVEDIASAIESATYRDRVVGVRFLAPCAFGDRVELTRASGVRAGLDEEAYSLTVALLARLWFRPTTYDGGRRMHLMPEQLLLHGMQQQMRCAHDALVGGPPLPVPLRAQMRSAAPHIVARQYEFSRGPHAPPHAPPQPRASSSPHPPALVGESSSSALPAPPMPPAPPTLATAARPSSSGTDGGTADGRSDPSGSGTVGVSGVPSARPPSSPPPRPQPLGGSASGGKHGKRPATAAGLSGGSSQDGSPIDETRNCVVCYINAADSLMRPCGHSVLCLECALTIFTRGNKPTCVICRAIIHSVLRRPEEEAPSSTSQPSGHCGGGGDGGRDGEDGGGGGGGGGGSGGGGGGGGGGAVASTSSEDAIHGDGVHSAGPSTSREHVE